MLYNLIISSCGGQCEMRYRDIEGDYDPVPNASAAAAHISEHDCAGDGWCGVLDEAHAFRVTPDEVALLASTATAETTTQTLP